MFVFSVKTSRKQLLSLGLCILMLIAILVVAVAWPSSSTAQTGADVAAKDETQRLQFLKSLGYEVEPQHTEVREVLIPDEFDEVFAQYNQLQQAAGMDFQPYHGKRTKCWTYQILNHPGGKDVLAHLYVYDDCVIGGDISSTSLNGFMTALVPLEKVG